ncbi:hypothetical protein CEXT_442611 [Caerostris extrusa]|uniref:Uncharacterized protein n=1 Tax=Caerostris extrusa TaxID=172846 RepID=A0AAV4PC73_CAEEX|nr:hypothetical protein CEXT_442611 [Caerostris extrusa]
MASSRPSRCFVCRGLEVSYMRHFIRGPFWKMKYTHFLLSAEDTGLQLQLLQVISKQATSRGLIIAMLNIESSEKQSPSTFATIPTKSSSTTESRTLST